MKLHAAALTAALAFAATTGIAEASPVVHSWTMGECTVECGTDGPNGNSRTFTSDNGMTVTVRGYMLDHGVITTAFVGHYDSNGLGITNPWESGGSNSHTVDNSQQYEFMTLEFSGEVNMNTLGLGAYGDTDLSGWIGMSGFTLVGKTLAEIQPYLTSIGTSEGGTGSRTASFNNMESGNMLVIAAQPGESDDFMKIKSIGATAVPEPATLATLGQGLLGLGWMRRRSA